MSTHAGGAMPLRAQGVIELTSWENEAGPSQPTAHPIERLDWASFQDEPGRKLLADTLSKIPLDSRLRR